MAPALPFPARIFARALALFALAALAGFAFRHAVLHGPAAGVSLLHVRHAHSHLMYMGWVTPALMAVMARALPRLGGRPLCGLGRWGIRASLLVALLAFPAFLAFGYGPAELGAARVPVAAVLSALAILAWYAVAIGYLAAARGVRRGVALRAWDAAFALLGLSTLGAWVQAGLMFGPEQPVLRAASLHLFLDLFGGGWMVFGLLAWVSERLPPLDRPLARRALTVAAFAVPFTFLLGLPADFLSGTGLALRHAAAGLTGAALAVFAVAALRRARRDAPELLIPLAALTLHALGQIGASSPELFELALQGGLRLFFLHVLFLGAVTLGLYSAFARDLGLDVHAPLSATALLVVLSLLPLTDLWPEAWSGGWRLHLAKLAALGPAVVVVFALLRALVRRRGLPVPAAPSALAHGRS